MPDGTISIYIGKWFKAIGIFLISDASVTYSKEVIDPTGLPLWAAMSVTFTPYRSISKEEWRSFTALGR